MIYSPKDEMQEAPQGGEQDTAGKPESNEMEGQTGLVSMDIFGGKPPEVGAKCEFEVVAVHDNEVEVRYAGEAGEEGTARERMHKDIGKYAGRDMPEGDGPAGEGMA